LSCDRELGSSWLPISVEGGSAGGLARGQSQRAVATAAAEVASKYASNYVVGLVDLPAADPVSAALTQTLLGGPPGENEQPHPLMRPEMSGTQSIIKSPDHRPWTPIGLGVGAPDASPVPRSLTWGAADDLNHNGFASTPGDDPRRVTWFDDEMAALCETAAQLGMPVAVHTGAAEGCKQAIRCGVRSLEHAYLIDDEALDMAESAGVFLVPTTQATREDRAGLAKGTLADYTAAKFPRDAEQIEHSQRLIAASNVKIAYGTDCGTFPFSHGNLEFQAMVATGISPARALRAATATAAELLGREDIGVLEPGRVADIVAMPGDPIDDIGRTADVDFVMRSGHLHRRPDDSSARPHR
jgi:hypothetical protein